MDSRLSVESMTKVEMPSASTGMMIFPSSFMSSLRILRDGLGAGEEADDPDGTHCLAQHGGNGSTLYAHAQPEDEDGVQHDVDDRADNGGQHTDLGKALRGDEGVHAKHDQHADGAQNVDAAVSQSVGQGGVTGTKQPQQGGCGCVKDDGQDDREEQQHSKAVADDLSACFLSPWPMAMAVRSAAGADEHGKGVQEHQDGGKQAHAGQSRRADPRMWPM